MANHITFGQIAEYQIFNQILGRIVTCILKVGEGGLAKMTN